jgi:hypothetical protein
MRSPGRAVAVALLAWAACAGQVAAQTAAAELAPAEAPPPNDLASPAQVSTRGSAYSLPARTWGFDVGALGISSGDAYARLGVAYGIGAGFQVDLNLLHWAVGLFNVNARWQFLDTRYVDMGAGVGFIYGHGDWFWIATAERLASAIDIMAIPFSLTTSVQPKRWLQLDLGLQYGHAEVWGSVGEEDSLYADAELGVRQFMIRPGVRFYVSKATSVDFVATLPPYTAAPTEGSVETQLPGVLFGGTRTAGQIANRLYGAKIYPSFDVEWRL